MSQNQNSIKNLAISAGLLTFIVSSGAFTVYQVIKANNPSTNSGLSISSQIIDVGLTSPVVGDQNTSMSDSMQKTELQKNAGEVLLTFDPYISGSSITGMIDNPENLQSLVVKLTEVDQPNNVLEFMPKIDPQKNFNISLDSNVKNAQYKMEYIMVDVNQKEYKSETMIAINTQVNASAPVTTQQIPASDIPAPQDAIEKKTETPATAPTSPAASMDIANPIANQNVEGMAPQNPSMENSSTISPDAIRTGGINLSYLIIAAVATFVGYITLIRSNYRKPTIETIFGFKK